jgi:hypothetical protein
MYISAAQTSGASGVDYTCYLSVRFACVFFMSNERQRDNLNCTFHLKHGMLCVLDVRFKLNVRFKLVVCLPFDIENSHKKGKHSSSKCNRPLMLLKFEEQKSAKKSNNILRRAVGTKLHLSIRANKTPLTTCKLMTIFLPHLYNETLKESLLCHHGSNGRRGRRRRRQ